MVFYNVFEIGSVHGVICFYDNSNNLLLFNPSIRKFLRLPFPKKTNCSMYNDSKYCCFWIDPSNYEFKVVLFRFEAELGKLYASSKQQWVDFAIGENIGGFHPMNDSSTVLIDCVAHWIAWTCNGPFARGVIVTFDFGLEKLGTIELPKCLRNIDECFVQIEAL